MSDLVEAGQRPPARHLAVLLVIITAVGQASGLVMAKPTFMGWNDISRWCTVWSLLERGTYVIDECPWQSRTQDKVFKLAPTQTTTDSGDSAKHFYSSKPPLLATLIAGLLYPFRMAADVPLEAKVSLGGGPLMPAYILYFKPIILLLNVVPFGVFLALYARLLDRYAASDWSWFVSLFAAAWATPLFVFIDSLNNHTVGAFSAFFAVYPALQIWEKGKRDVKFFALTGFFGAFCACNELPAALFVVMLFVELFLIDRRKTLLYFLPWAAIPCLAFFTSQYLSIGSLVPAYARPEWYHYKGSYWNDPEGADLFTEPKPIYLFHMLAGHHGVFSLTPVFLFSVYAIIQSLRGRINRLSTFVRMIGGLTVAVIAFYAWTTHNYGGPSQALRWLLWLFPLWLILLPQGFDAIRERPWFHHLAVASLFVSAFSTGYALQSSWTRPWLQQVLIFTGLYPSF